MFEIYSQLRKKLVQPVQASEVICLTVFQGEISEKNMTEERDKEVPTNAIHMFRK